MSIHFARVFPANFATRIITLATVGILMFTVGCSEAADPIEAFDANTSPALPVNDAATSAYDAGSIIPSGGYDASVTPVTDASASDASQLKPDAGAQSDAGDAASQPSDASTTGDAASDAGSVKDASADGGFVFPDLFPRNDAGPAPTSDAGTGGRNPNGPCKDLNLLCFDFIDMYFNAECFTCNGGKGCQGCAIPFAY